jgi:hypothetical protein
MTDVFSGTITGTGSGTVGAIDTSYTVNDAITVDLTYQFHVSGNVVHYDVSGSVVQNVTTITKITQDGKTSTSTFAKSLISEISGKEPAVDGGTLFSLAGAIGTNSSESLYFNFRSAAIRPILLVGGSVTVEGTTVPLQGGLNPGVYVPPTLLYEYYSFIDLFHNGHPSPLGISDPLVPSPLLGFSLTAGSADRPENSAGISLEAAHASTLALLGNYIASSFPTATGGHGETLSAQSPQTGQLLPLTHPHG